MEIEKIDFKNYNYGVYARKSSESEDKQVQSIERQISDILEIGNREKLNFCIEPLTESQSAFVPGRSHFNKLIELTYARKINAWFCWHPNRLSRNSIDAGTIVYLMDLGLLQHIRTPTRIYFNNPTDKMMLQIEFTMSKKDSDDKSSAVKSGLKQRYKKGLPNGKAPIGFINDKSKEKGDRGWLIDKARFRKVELLFKRFLKGTDSISSITNYAQRKLRITTRKTKRQGGDIVNRSQVYHILINPIYAGFFYAKNENGLGKSRHELSSEMPRIISEEGYFNIKAMLSNRTTPKTQVHKRAYSGFIFSPDGDYCGVDAKFQLICDCKKKFAYLNKVNCPSCSVHISKMKSPKYLSYYYYYNVKRRKAKGVKARAISENKIEEYLVDFIEKNLSLPDEFAQWAKKQIPHLKDKVLDEKRTIEKARSQAVENFEKEKKKLRKMYRLDMISEEEFATDLKELNTKYENVDMPIDQNDGFDRLEEILDLSVVMKEIIQDDKAQGKIEVLTKFGSNLTWNEKIISINKAKWLSTYIKGRKRLLAKYDRFEPKNNVANKGRNACFEALRPTLLHWLDDVRTYLRKGIKC